jgi:hypothetical protein
MKRLPGPIQPHMRALILFGVLCSACLPAPGEFWNLPDKAVAEGPHQSVFPERLSLTHTVVGRLDNRSPNLSHPSFRRQETSTSLPPSCRLCLFDTAERRLTGFGRIAFDPIISTSSPTDRAPPFRLV